MIVGLLREIEVIQKLKLFLFAREINNVQQNRKTDARRRLKKTTKTQKKITNLSICRSKQRAELHQCRINLDYMPSSPAAFAWEANVCFFVLAPVYAEQPAARRAPGTANNVDDRGQPGFGTAGVPAIVRPL